MYEIRKSKIHGEGIFATRKINKDEVIGIPLYLKYYFIPVITREFGRKINHSYDPNSILQKNQDAPASWSLIANKTIRKGEEITLNYENTPWFIDGPMPWYK